MIRLLTHKPNKLLIKSCYESINRLTIKDNISNYGGFIDDYNYNKFTNPLILTIRKIVSDKLMWRGYNEQFNTISYLIDDLKLNTDYGLIIVKKYNPILFFKNDLFKYKDQELITIDIDYFKHLYTINKQMKELNLFYKYR